MNFQIVIWLCYTDMEYKFGSWLTTQIESTIYTLKSKNG